eukprot:358152-Chlamydomonas_euryale.AAC.11
MTPPSTRRHLSGGQSLPLPALQHVRASKQARAIRGQLDSEGALHPCFARYPHALALAVVSAFTHLFRCICMIGGQPHSLREWRCHAEETPQRVGPPLTAMSLLCGRESCGELW